MFGASSAGRPALIDSTGDRRRRPEESSSSKWVPEVVQEPCHDREYLVLIDAFDERRMELNGQADEFNVLFGQASEENRIRVVVTSPFLKGVEQGDVLGPEVCPLGAVPLLDAAHLRIHHQAVCEGQR